MIYNNKNCFGCGLCAYICPQKCIKMEADSEGFLSPIVNESMCVKCGLCEKKCPALHLKKLPQQSQSYYLAWLNDYDLRYKSSSGGAFSALAIPILEDGGIVIGAAYDESFGVRHVSANDKSELELLRKSKYLQSDMHDMYEVVAETLRRGQKVLFTGTPCQCAAMRTAFPKEDQLYICDIICHGVQSPMVFRDALSFMEKKANGKCISVDFRSKSKGWANACTAEVLFNNGKKINKRANDIPIGAGFSKNLAIRKPCEQCKYRTMDRPGDITIGDFWAARDNRALLKEYGDMGYSSIIVNSQKGEELLHRGSAFLTLIEKRMEDVQEQNNPLWKQFSPNPDRDAFFDDYRKMGFDEIYKKYLKPDYQKIIRWHLIRLGRKTGLLEVYRKLRGL